MSTKLGPCLLIAASFASTPSLADPQCRPAPLISLAFDSKADDLAVVPATINNQPATLIVDTGGSFGLMSANAVEKFGLKIDSRIRKFGTVFGGVNVRDSVHVDSLKLGAAPEISTLFAIVPANAISDAADGVLGGDTLSQYDVEFDFAGGRLNLFAHERCEGRFLAEMGTNFSAVSMLSSSGHHVGIPIILEGKNLTAVLDTGAEKTSMSLKTAHDVFDLSAENGSLKSTSSVSVNGGPPKHVYQAAFKSLKIAGVALTNPNVQIIDGELAQQNAPQVLLGLDNLRQLRIFIAYDERIVYLARSGDR